MKKKEILPKKVPALEVVEAPHSTVVPVSRDPLQRYLQELARYPVLSPEVQQEIAVRYKKTGDINLAKALITSNLRLVVKIAMEYRSSYSNILDLVQEGNVGLMKAVSNYDPYKGTRLSYYASWWIRSYILKFLLDNFRLVKLGTTQAQKKLFYNLMREKERLEAQGMKPEVKLLADSLEVREKDVKLMNQRLSESGMEYSIDQPITEGGTTTRGDLIMDPTEIQDETLMRRQLEGIFSDHIADFLKTLNERERVIFHERMFSDEPKTLQEIADQYRITRERARQIESQVLAKLKTYMSAYIDGVPKKVVAKKKAP